MAKLIIDYRPTQKRFGEMAKRHKDFRQFWPEVAKPLLQKEIDYIFDKRGVPRWAKRKHPAPHPLLEKTGTLRRSWTIAKRKGNVLRFRRDSIIFGTSLPYASALEYGTKHMPARPVLQTLLKSRRGARKSVGRAMTEALSDYLQKPFKGRSTRKSYGG